jgi:hypothetical protein
MAVPTTEADAFFDDAFLELLKNEFHLPPLAETQNVLRESSANLLLIAREDEGVRKWLEDFYSSAMADVIALSRPPPPASSSSTPMMPTGPPPAPATTPQPQPTGALRRRPGRPLSEKTLAKRQKQEAQLALLFDDKDVEPGPLAYRPMVYTLSEKGHTMYGCHTARITPGGNPAITQFRRHFSGIIEVFSALTRGPPTNDNVVKFKAELSRWRADFTRDVAWRAKPPSLNWTKQNWGVVELAFIEFMRKKDYSEAAVDAICTTILRDTPYGEVACELIKEEAKLGEAL